MPAKQPQPTVTTDDVLLRLCLLPEPARLHVLNQLARLVAAAERRDRHPVILPTIPSPQPALPC